MATSTIEYGTSGSFAITLASLAHDASLVAGRASAAVDNTVTKAVDYLVQGKIMTAASGTLTTARQIEIWVFSSLDGVTYSGGVPGTDAAVTFASEKALLQRAVIIPTDATVAHSYEFGPFSVASLFGGIMPPYFGIFVVQNTALALHATPGNHEIKYRPIKYASS